jgi:cell division protein FtsN
MSRPAKPRSQPQKKSSSLGNTFAGIFIGLVIGVLIAAALAWYFSRPYEFLKKGENAVPGPTQSITGSKPIALPGKPGDKPVEHPAGVETATAAPAAAASPAAGEKKFDFYDILKKGDQATLPAPDKAQSAPAASGDKLYLQLGAFSDPSEADNLKAQLALTGTEASVQRVETPDKGALYRVRIGPYSTPEDMDHARAQLAQLGIESSVVKVKNKDAAAAPR